MTDLAKLNSIFSMFSCVGFRLAFIGKRGAPSEQYPMGDPIKELYATGAYRGATAAWEHFAREHSVFEDLVFADIEHRPGTHDGKDWHVDIVTDFRTSSHYDCWYASRVGSLEEAYRTIEWLSRNNWEVLRSKPAERNSGRRLTPDEKSELERYASNTNDSDDGSHYTFCEPSLEGQELDAVSRDLEAERNSDDTRSE